MSALLPGRADPRRLVDVEECRTVEEHRRENEARKERCRTRGVVREALEQQRSGDLGHEDEHRERGKAAESVGVVGASEREPSPKRSLTPSPSAIAAGTARPISANHASPGRTNSVASNGNGK